MTIPPPTESKLFARRFRAAVAEADEPAAVAMHRCVEPVLKRARRNAVPRYETLVDAARCWPNLVSAEFRLDLSVHKTKRGPTMLLRDVRIVAGHTVIDEQSREGVTVLLVELKVEPGRAAFTMTPVAAVQLHALERWHQRSFHPTAEALLRDLAVLAASYEAAVDRAARLRVHDFAVSAGDGVWAGEVVWQSAPAAKSEHSVMLWTKTFLNDAMISQQQDE